MTANDLEQSSALVTFSNCLCLLYGFIDSGRQFALGQFLPKFEAQECTRGVPMDTEIVGAVNVLNEICELIHCILIDDEIVIVDHRVHSLPDSFHPRFDGILNVLDILRRPNP